MNSLKPDFRKLTVAITLGALSIGFAPAANAVSTYDATAGLTLTLTSVTDAAGAPVADGWSVFAEYQWPSTSIESTGDSVAYASATTNIDEGSGILFLDVLDSVTLLSTSDGMATNGTATSSATNPLYMSIYGSGVQGQSLIFSFDYDITAIALATGDDAIGSAAVSLWDYNGFIDILPEANASSIGPISDVQSTAGSFNVVLNYGEFDQFVGYANSSGFASAVPIPAAVWLFGSGLIGLIGIARRKKV